MTEQHDHAGRSGVPGVDTIHNFADAPTALPIGIAFVLGRRVATRRYTYGLGRAEDLAGVVVVLIIAGSAAFAGYESVPRLINPQPVSHLWVVVVAGGDRVRGQRDRRPLPDHRRT